MNSIRLGPKRSDNGPDSGPASAKPMAAGVMNSPDHSRGQVEDVLEVEGHHAEYGVPGQEAEEAGRGSQREYLPPEELQVEHRHRGGTLPIDESRQQADGERQPSYRGRRSPAYAVRGRHDQQEHDEAARREKRSHPVEAGGEPSQASDLGRVADENDGRGGYRDESQRDSEQKHGSPAEGVHYEAADDWPHYRAHSHHGHEQPYDTTAFPGGEGGGEYRHAVGLYHGGARALHESEGYDRHQIGGQPCQRRANDEDEVPAYIDDLAPYHVGQASGGQKQRAGGEYVAERDPLYIWNGGAEVPGHDGQRESDACLVQNGHESARGDCQENQPALARVGDWYVCGIQYRLIVARQARSTETRRGRGDRVFFSRSP